jgi:hypothetical protein
MDRAQELYAADQVRLHAAVSAVQVSPGQSGRVKAASAAFEAAR